MRFVNQVLLFSASVLFLFPAATSAQLVVTGVFDGPLSGGLPKVIEVCVVGEITDFSNYGIGSANNGDGTDGEEFTFTAIIPPPGTFFYVASDSASFHEYFGFPPSWVSDAANINGDDAIEVFGNGTVIDVFGDINVDGTGEAWEHLDGWAYRNDGIGPSGTTFNIADWSFSGVDAVDGCATNSDCSSVYPIGDFDYTSLPVEAATWGGLKRVLGND